MVTLLLLFWTGARGLEHVRSLLGRMAAWGFVAASRDDFTNNLPLSRDTLCPSRKYQAAFNN